MSTRKPPTIGPLIVRKVEPVKGDQFYARLEAERGTRLAIDGALAASLDALDAELSLLARVSLEADRAFLLEKRDDNDGTKPLSPQEQAACERLVRMGQAARDQRAARLEAQRAARVQAETEARAAAEKAALVEAQKAALAQAETEARAQVEMATARAEAKTAARVAADIKKDWGATGGRGRTVLTESGVKALRAFWAEQGWDLDKYKRYDRHNKSRKEKSAKELGVGMRQVDRYIEAFFRKRSERGDRQGAAK